MADGPGGYFRVPRTAWALAGCGLVMAAGLRAPPRAQLDGNPVPSAGQVQAAQNKVNQGAAALGKQEEKLAAANAKLTDLETQAEILTENPARGRVSRQFLTRPGRLVPQFPGQLPAGQDRSRLGARPDRPPLPVGRCGPLHLRLLGADDGCLGPGRRRAAALHG